MNKKKIVTILIIIATVILAGVAVFTAVRLYQLRQEAVAPTAPEEPEAAAPESCTALTFTITQESPTPTPTESPTPTGTGSPTPTPTESPTATPTSTATATATPTSTAVAEASPTTEPELPEAGVSYPTIIGSAVGILLILISLVLAL